MRRKRSGFVSLILVLMIGAMLARAGNAPADPSEEVVKYLDTTIDWYRRVISFIQSPVNTDEVLFHDAVGLNTLQTLRLGFTFAHAEADLLDATQKGAPAASPTTKTDAAGKIQRAAQQAAQRIALLQSQLDDAQQQAQAASPTSQPALNARRDKIKAALNLAQERQQVIADFQAFSTDSGNKTLAEQVDDLQRAVPEASGASDAPSPIPPATQQTLAPHAIGVIGLVGLLFDLQHRMGDLQSLADETETLTDANKALRDPILAALLDAVHRSDVLAKERDSNDPAVLDAQRQEIEAITARYKLLTAVIVPLGEQNVVLESTHENLISWREALQRGDYKRVLTELIVRLGAMAFALLVLMGISKAWRRITFRYVTDIRRRRQFLVVRRLVVGSFVIIILIGGVVTEFASLATYAGLLTAGVAVALQTIILSGAAHFFLIGRYGVRVGDRVTIGGITGDVIEIGLFRLYLMELGGSHVYLQPTGRVAVFSNSVLFQPTAFYKQLPGAEYAWRELALTLSPDSDYKLAEERLMKTVEGIYNEYRETIVQQHAEMKESLHFVLPDPHPEGSLRFVEAGLEFVVRYPVELRNAAEIDDRVTRALLVAIEAEPKLKIVASGTPTIQAVVA